MADHNNMSDCKIDRIILKVGSPSYIGSVIGRAIVIARMTKAVVCFAFQGVAISVTQYDKVGDVLDYYNAAYDKRRGAIAP